MIFLCENMDCEYNSVVVSVSLSRTRSVTFAPLGSSLMQIALAWKHDLFLMYVVIGLLIQQISLIFCTYCSWMIYRCFSSSLIGQYLCDCNMVWFVRYLLRYFRKRLIPNFDRITCKAPDTFLNVAVVKLNENDICPQKGTLLLLTQLWNVILDVYQSRDKSFIEAWFTREILCF
jgi:hypothetical protein